MRVLRYLNKFIGSLILLALVVIAVTFAVSNRTEVSLDLWPLPFEASVQIGAIVLAALALGVIVGTALMSASRFKTHRRARRSERRVASLEKVAQKASATLPAPATPAPTTTVTDTARQKALSGQ